MRNALNRSDTIDCQRLYKKDDGTPMGFVFTWNRSQDSRSTIVDIATQHTRTKFIDPDYTITFIRGQNIRQLRPSRTKLQYGRRPAPTAVDNAEKMGIISRILPHPLEDQISMNIKTKVPIKDPEAMMSEMCELCVERGETSGRIHKSICQVIR
jgi:hypothetical protein